jgi:hypothetical protein
MTGGVFVFWPSLMILVIATMGAEAVFGGGAWVAVGWAAGMTAWALRHGQA